MPFMVRLLITAPLITKRRCHTGVMSLSGDTLRMSLYLRHIKELNEAVKHVVSVGHKLPARINSRTHIGWVTASSSEQGEEQQRYNSHSRTVMDVCVLYSNAGAERVMWPAGGQIDGYLWCCSGWFYFRFFLLLWYWSVNARHQCAQVSALASCRSENKL